MPSVRPLRVTLFVGPSASVDDVRAAWAGVDADLSILPPVEQGDLLRLSRDLPDVLGIVDGFFFQVPAVTHKEILLALEDGARVMGAASLGALRAAELDVYGMEGVGEIYRWYRRGRVDADDEVAVLHAEAAEGYRALSEPLVNIRHNLRRARAGQVVSAATARAVLTAARRAHFSERSYPGALDAARRDGADGAELDRLAGYLRDEAVDLKRADALALVRTIAARVGGMAAWPARPAVHATRSMFLHTYAAEYVGTTVDGRHVTDRLVLGLERLLAPDFPAFQQRMVARCLALDEARERGLVPANAEALVAHFQARHPARADAQFSDWLARQRLTEAELVGGLRERDLERRILAVFRALHPDATGRAAVTRRIAAAVAARTGETPETVGWPLRMRPRLPWEEPLLRELKLRGGFEPALARAARIARVVEAFCEQHPRFDRRGMPADWIHGWVARRWDVELAGLAAAAAQRGFENYEHLVEPASHAFVYQRLARQPLDDAPLDDARLVNAPSEGADARAAG